MYVKFTPTVSPPFHLPDRPTNHERHSIELSRGIQAGCGLSHPGILVSRSSIFWKCPIFERRWSKLPRKDPEQTRTALYLYSVFTTLLYSVLPLRGRSAANKHDGYDGQLYATTSQIGRTPSPFLTDAVSQKYDNGNVNVDGNGNDEAGLFPEV